MISPEQGDEFAQATRQILLRSNAIIEDDHFVYDSGEHGRGWIDKDVINAQTDREEVLCTMLADTMRDLVPEVVCGPATGGIVVAQWTAHALGSLAVFAEHDASPARGVSGPVRGAFALRRGYDELVAGKRVIVVDDVINTGLSIRQTVQAVENAGGHVVAVGALVSRGNAWAGDLGVHDARWLLEVQIPSWPAADCELCRQGVPINTRYAHGRDYLASLGRPYP
jgi:orotate phosphoribosyltransferase